MLVEVCGFVEEVCIKFCEGLDLLLKFVGSVFNIWFMDELFNDYY